MMTRSARPTCSGHIADPLTMLGVIVAALALLVACPDVARTIFPVEGKWLGVSNCCWFRGGMIVVGGVVCGLRWLVRRA